MKIITKEEEKAHYATTVRGGLLGGFGGLAAGLGATVYSHKRFPGFRSMGIPFKVFLVTSATTFGGIIFADRASRKFERERDPMNSYIDRAQREAQDQKKSESVLTRLKELGRENRYGIIGASWILSMAVSLALVSRNRYLTAGQKLVQARVYAQGLTLAVFIASAGIEFQDANNKQGRWEKVQVIDPNDPEHKKKIEIERRVHNRRYKGEDLWKGMFSSTHHTGRRDFYPQSSLQNAPPHIPDHPPQIYTQVLGFSLDLEDMVEAEERRLQERDQVVHEEEERHRREHARDHKKHNDNHRRPEKPHQQKDDAERQDQK